MISINSYIVKSAFHKSSAKEDAPVSKSGHINLSPTGFNWYKSPIAITLKPPKTAFVPVSCSKRVSIKLSVLLPTINISSIIITFRCLYFILNVFNSSADRRFVPWYIFLWNAEQIVWPLILKAAKPMKTQRRIIISSGIIPSLRFKILYRLW